VAVRLESERGDEVLTYCEDCSKQFESAISARLSLGRSSPGAGSRARIVGVLCLAM
jgi:hypothetical protein